MFPSDHGRSLPIENGEPAVPKQKIFLDSKEEYPKLSVKQLTQWISNTKILFKTNRSYKNNNRKITEYFGKDSARENNISTKDMLNKTRSSEDNNNSKIHSNNYIDKEWVHKSGKNINDHSNHREVEKTNYLTDPTSILPAPTETKTIFGNNKAERIISIKHRPVQKELLDKTNLHTIK